MSRGREEFAKWWRGIVGDGRSGFLLPGQERSFLAGYEAAIEAAAQAIEDYICPDCRHEGGFHYNTECGNADLVAAVRELAEKPGVPKT